MTVTRQSRTVYRAERTLTFGQCNCTPTNCRCPDEYIQRRTFLSEWSAYLWVARGALFRARDARCTCDGAWQRRGEGDGCKLCDPAKWHPVVARLARILRSRDRRVSA